MRYIKILAVIVTAILVCTIGYYVIKVATVIKINEDKPYSVLYVIDGDTFKVKVGRHNITVRMLGIDTPETVDPRKPAQCFGKEASDQTKALLTDKMVQLKLNPKREEKDRYGRYLAYVYVDNIFVNKTLIENGYAREYTYGKAYMFQKEFREAEKVAKDLGNGLWGLCELPVNDLSKSLISLL